MDSEELNRVIVRAKAASYVGGGAKVTPSRQGANEIAWEEGDWRYLDSYFGGTDFLGQEVLWHRNEPIWAMNYYGYIKRPDLIDAGQAGAIIQDSLSALYRKGRFLGGFVWLSGGCTYQDRNDGGPEQFRGREAILVGGVEAYALEYFGGLVKA
ncbi:hypothetical protein JHL21_07490 [Devosia sp. WQ 349]|uniref:DUF5680 domain-containing protein n=1 Tax=Devosia sp. WQ 349K1 TaxID=2800329 RepID=UPI0019075BFB|nr:DUF5680 domain-containing protein [Devosia sp. WQ 349K1]MBK1794343.1 hypothetical protein [Devosia sp. WQ 349K1]